MKNPWLIIAGFFGLTGVALQAFLAHALKGSLSEKHLMCLETGSKYQMLHAIVLLILASNPDFLKSYAPIAFVLGICMFSGSLYLLAADVPHIGWVTPIGGIMLLLGWFFILLQGW